MLHSVDWTDLDMPMLGENRNPPDTYTFKFTAGNCIYICDVACQNQAFVTEMSY